MYNVHVKGVHESAEIQKKIQFERYLLPFLNLLIVFSKCRLQAAEVLRKSKEKTFEKKWLESDNKSKNVLLWQLFHILHIKTLNGEKLSIVDTMCPTFRFPSTATRLCRYSWWKVLMGKSFLRGHPSDPNDPKDPTLWNMNKGGTTLPYDLEILALSRIFWKIFTKWSLLYKKW